MNPAPALFADLEAVCVCGHDAGIHRFRVPHACAQALCECKEFVKAQPPTCAWRQDDTESAWETGCGKAFEFTSDGPAENGFRFCYACGKPIDVTRLISDGSETT